MSTLYYARPWHRPWTACRRSAPPTPRPTWGASPRPAARRRHRAGRRRRRARRTAAVRNSRRRRRPCSTRDGSSAGRPSPPTRPPTPLTTTMPTPTMPTPTTTPTPTTPPTTTTRRGCAAGRDRCRRPRPPPPPPPPPTCWRTGSNRLRKHDDACYRFYARFIHEKHETKSITYFWARIQHIFKNIITRQNTWSRGLYVTDDGQPIANTVSPRWR